MTSISRWRLVCHKATLVTDCDKFMSNSLLLCLISFDQAPLLANKLLIFQIVMKMTKNRHRMQSFILDTSLAVRPHAKRTTCRRRRFRLQQLSPGNRGLRRGAYSPGGLPERNRQARQWLRRRPHALQRSHAKGLGLFGTFCRKIGRV